MARRQIIESDLSGKEVVDGAGAKMTISYDDKRRGIAVLDITVDEADEYAAKGKAQRARGRRPVAQRGAGNGGRQRRREPAAA